MADETTYRFILSEEGGGEAPAQTPRPGDATRARQRAGDDGADAVPRARLRTIDPEVRAGRATREPRKTDEGSDPLEAISNIVNVFGRLPVFDRLSGSANALLSSASDLRGLASSLQASGKVNLPAKGGATLRTKAPAEVPTEVSPIGEVPAPIQDLLDKIAVIKKGAAALPGAKAGKANAPATNYPAPIQGLFDQLADMKKQAAALGGAGGKVAAKTGVAAAGAAAGEAEAGTGLLAMLGPIGAVGIAAGAAATGLNLVTAKANALAKEYSAYEGTLATANARRQAMQQLEDISSARKIGPQLGRYSDASGRLERIAQRIQTLIEGAALEKLVPILEILAKTGETVEKYAPAVGNATERAVRNFFPSIDAALTLFELFTANSEKAAKEAADKAAEKDDLFTYFKEYKGVTLDDADSAQPAANYDQKRVTFGSPGKAEVAI